MNYQPEWKNRSSKTYKIIGRRKQEDVRKLNQRCTYYRSKKHWDETWNRVKPNVCHKTSTWRIKMPKERDPKGHSRVLWLNISFRNFTKIEDRTKGTVILAVTKDAIKKALKSIKRGKAPGEEGINIGLKMPESSQGKTFTHFYKMPQTGKNTKHLEECSHSLNNTWTRRSIGLQREVAYLLPVGSLQNVLKSNHKRNLRHKWFKPSRERPGFELDWTLNHIQTVKKVTQKEMNTKILSA